MLPSTSYPDFDQDIVTPGQCIASIVAAEGQLELAAERLFGLPKVGQPSPKARLIATIASDPVASRALADQLRILTLLQAFQSAQKVGYVVDGSLERMQPNDMARLYQNLLTVVSTLTVPPNDPSQSLTFNMTEMVFNKLPPEIQEAIKVLSLPAQSEPDEPDYLTSHPPGSDDEVTIYDSPTDIARLGPANAANGDI